jgi:hypothetical protein
MSQNIDIAKKQLMKLDNFIAGLQQELVTLAQYTDVGPSRALYAHIRELIKDLLNTKNAQEFHQKFAGLNQAVAGILIVIVPTVSKSVARNMQKAHGTDFDPQKFADLVKSMNENVNTNISANPEDPIDPSQPVQWDDEPDNVENSAEEAVKMLDLQDYVRKPKVQPDSPDTLGGVWEKYK